MSAARQPGKRGGVQAGQRRFRRTSLTVSHDDELLLDALRESLGPDAGVGEILRLGLRQLAAEKGIDLEDLRQGATAAA